MQLILIITAITLVEAAAQYYIKKYHANTKLSNYLIGVGLYAIVAYLLTHSYNYSSMGMSQVLWSGLGVVAIFTISYLIFGEKISRNELIGSGFILLGVGITQFK